MQLQAYVTLNGSKPYRSMLSYGFERAKVSDLCAYVASKLFCPPGSTYKVSLKTLEPNGDPVLYVVAPDVDLRDGAEMVVTVDPPSADTASFQLPTASPGRYAFSQSQPSTPRCSQADLDASFNSFISFDATHGTSTTEQPVHATTTATATAAATDFPCDANFMDQMQALLSSETPSSSSAPSASTPGKLSHATLLTAFYVSHRRAVDDTFIAMKPGDTVLINDLDVYDFFDLPVRKTSLFILKNPTEHDVEVLAAAKYVSKKSLVDILVKAYPEYSCPQNACEPAKQFLIDATGNDWFRNLTTTDGTSLVMNAFRKRKNRYRDSRNPRDPETPVAAKKRRVVVDPPAPGDLDAAAVALAACSTEKETRKLVVETASVRHAWIKTMESENADQIPETFMKKFPCFLSDASLLHEDYKCSMIHRGLPVASFSDAFKTLIPAVYALAVAKNVHPSNIPRPADEDDDAWLACKLLIALVPLYCKKHKNCKPERIFAEAWDNSYINALHQIRRNRKQTAPMIFVVNKYPSGKRAYLVATDDFALTVKGTFFDALQSLMELHYVFDLAYATEMKPFFLFLEKIAEVNHKKTFTALMDLYYDLLQQSDTLTETDENSESAPSSNPENLVPLNETEADVIPDGQP